MDHQDRLKFLEDELDVLLDYKELCTNDEEDDAVDARITQLILMMTNP